MLILKILGILILSILALILLILCALLFVPVTYRLELEKQERAEVTAKVGWLLSFVSVRYRLQYPGEDGGLFQDLQVKILGFTVLRPFAQEEEKPPDKQKKKKKNKSKREKKETHKASEAEIRREESADGQPYDGSDRAKHQECEQTASCSEGTQNQKTEEPHDLPQHSLNETKHKEKKPRVPLSERIRGIFRKIAGVFHGLVDRMKHIGETLQNLLHKKDELLSFWRMEEFVRARAFLIKELKHLWKRYRPRRVEGALHFGFDDPSTTGLCMGALSVLSPWYPGKMDLTPDFDRKILEGNLEIRGHIQLYVLLFAALRFWRNRDVRYMYGRWKER